VSSLNKAMFDVVVDDGIREPAANILYEGSYDGQKASAEMMPVTYT